MLSARVRIKLKNQKNKHQCLRFDVTGDTTEYKAEVHNKLQTLLAVDEEKTRLFLE